MIKKNGLWAVFSATLTPSLIIEPNSKNWKIILANSAFENLTGKKNSIIIGAKSMEIFKEFILDKNDSIVKRIENSLKAAYSTQLIQSLPLLEVYIPIHKKKHTSKWKVVITPVTYIKHKLEAILISIVDLTEQVQYIEKSKAQFSKLASKQESYREIFVHYPDLLFKVDLEGNLLEANRTFYDFFSTASGIFPKQKLIQLVEPSEREIFIKCFQKCINGEMAMAKLNFRISKYLQAVLDIKLVPQFTKGSVSSINGIMIDRTSETELQHKMLKKSIFSEALSQIIQTIHLEYDHSKQLYQVLEVAGGALMVDRASIYKKEELTPSGQLITSKKIEWLKYKSQNPNLPLDNRYYLENIKTVKEAILGGKIFRANISDLRRGNLKATLQKYTINSLAITPIFIDQKFYGMIVLEDFTEGRSFTIEEINFLKNMRMLISIAIEKHNIENEK
ncbi:MAG TPA: GAF domain-containing protein, partial [Anditalea sp.]|nr:GAF domain-containing protein [Anditalea sp.]